MKFSRLMKLFDDQVPVLVMVSRDAHSGQMSFKYMWVTVTGEIECRLRALQGKTEPVDYLAVIESNDLKETIEYLIVDGLGSELSESNAGTKDYAFFYGEHPDHEQVLVLDNMDDTITVAVMMDDHVLYSIYLEGETLESMREASDAEMNYYVDMIYEAAGKLEIDGKPISLSQSGFGIH